MKKRNDSDFALFDAKIGYVGGEVHLKECPEEKILRIGMKIFSALLTVMILYEVEIILSNIV